MKKITAILLAGMLVLAGAGQSLASDDYSAGYPGKYYGIIEAMPAGYTGTWTVNGRSIEVGSQTKIEEEYGRAAVGAYVEVKGRTDGQVFHAYELEVKRSGHNQRNDDAYHRTGRD
jgi:hypothetical protein